MQFIAGQGQSGGGKPQAPQGQPQQKQEPPAEFNDEDDDIPF